MPTEIGIGHVEAQDKLTARLYYQPAGESGYIDVGNVSDFKEVHERTYVARMRSEKGVRITDNELIDTVADRFEFTLDEQDELNLKLLYLASRGSNSVQAAATAPAGVAAITNVTQGRSFFIGAVDLDTVVVQVSAVTKTEGTDYTIDLKTGRIAIIVGGGINDGDDLDITYGCAAVTFQVFTGQDELLFRGPIRIETVNQFSEVPVKVYTFTGILKVTAWPEHTGELGKHTVQALASTKPTITRRSAYAA